MKITWYVSICHPDEQCVDEKEPRLIGRGRDMLGKEMWVGWGSGFAAL